MSTVKARRFQLGQHATALNNVGVYVNTPEDGILRIGHGNLDAITERLRMGADGVFDFLAGMPKQGGNPIVDYGSNSNGHYVRYSDGTQICWQEGTTAYSTTNVWGNIFISTTRPLWTYPAAFASGVVFIPSAENPGTGSSMWAIPVFANLTNAEFYIVSAKNDGNGEARLLAIGRWF